MLTEQNLDGGGVGGGGGGGDTPRMSLFERNVRLSMCVPSKRIILNRTKSRWRGRACKVGCFVSFSLQKCELRFSVCVLLSMFFFY